VPLLQAKAVLVGRQREVKNATNRQLTTGALIDVYPAKSLNKTEQSRRLKAYSDCAQHHALYDAQVKKVLIRARLVLFLLCDAT
jgi:hypothetical protein